MIKQHTKKTVHELGQHYNDLSKVDKVFKANEEVKQLETELNVGIKKLVTNKENLSDMDEKAERMKCNSYVNKSICK